MTNVLNFPIGICSSVKLPVAAQETIGQDYDLMTGAVACLRDQLVKLTVELEFGKAQLAVMISANALVSAIAEERRRIAASHWLIDS
ncbi:hypothetical protein G6L16_024780 (plasmid) [Agrobacterium tumefaciens]|uniref:hypothetical protein n=1 Tax=Agrobacterium tumefaciens TaxID=358 RepID=UPI00157439FE|nr:hypothetical protein [Agrobacterium tumefaciens]NSZ66195.1 hypothetical protein [Agrobacterium tumefaciens]NTA72567.1 hypothetical protein [Agrobacterium tumefaciens]WIE41806.1 hypothetical protein G6L16_024780 [Agrobacterium tumefaciens]